MHAMFKRLKHVCCENYHEGKKLYIFKKHLRQLYIQKLEISPKLYSPRKWQAANFFYPKCFTIHSQSRNVSDTSCIFARNEAAEYPHRMRIEVSFILFRGIFKFLEIFPAIVCFLKSWTHVTYYAYVIISYCLVYDARLREAIHQTKRKRTRVFAGP